MSICRSFVSRVAGPPVRTRLVARLALVVALAVAMPAASPAQEEPVKFSLRLASGTGAIAPGSTFRVLLVATIDEGWHLYSTTQPPGGPLATRISLAKDQPFTLGGSIDAPPPRTVFDQNFGMNTELYDDEAVFTVPVTVVSGTAPGVYRLRVNTFFQACNDQLCLPPKTTPADLQVTIGSGAMQPAGATTGPVAPEPAPAVKEAARSGASTPPVPAASSTPRQVAVPEVKPAAASTAAAGMQAGTPAGADSRLSSTEAAVAPSPATPGVGATPSGQAPVAAFEPGAPAQTASSLWSFLWLAMTMGALSLLTPCVFPMIPVTVSYFTSQAAGSRKRAVGQALTYMVGIVLTFTALGMAMALMVGATGLGRFAASPWVNLFVGALFVAFALNLFGFYEIRIPSGLLTRLDTATRQSGNGQIVGTLLMALTFTLASISCTAPFIGTLLVMAAGGDWQWPLVGMLAFSTVLAFPFFLLALMPQLLAALPRSGGWMTAVKVMLGFVVIAASTKFFSNADLVWGWGVLTRDLVLASWVAVVLLMMAHILGMFRFEHDTPVKHVGPARLALGLACGTLAFWLASGLGGQPLGELDALLPLPAQAAGATAMTGAGELSWLVNDYEGALAEARRTSRRVFVDFTGYTCTNCKWMETNMFPREEVRRELQQFVRVRLYTDGEGELYQKQQQMQQAMFRTVAIPYYAVIDSSGVPVATFAGLTRDTAQFVRFLRQAQAPPAPQS